MQPCWRLCSSILCCCSSSTFLMVLAARYLPYFILLEYHVYYSWDVIFMGDTPAKPTIPKVLGCPIYYVAESQNPCFVQYNHTTLNSPYTSLHLMHVSCLPYPIICFVTDNAKTYQPTYIIYFHFIQNVNPKTSFSIKDLIFKSWEQRGIRICI